jgi:hypothetical protein
MIVSAVACSGVHQHKHTAQFVIYGRSRHRSHQEMVFDNPCGISEDTLLLSGRQPECHQRQLFAGMAGAGMGWRLQGVCNGRFRETHAWNLIFKRN